MKKNIVLILAIGLMSTSFASSICEQKLKAVNDMIGWQGQPGSAIEHLATNNDIFEDVLEISNNLGSNRGYIYSSDLRKINSALKPVLTGNQIAQKNMEDISIKLNELKYYCK